MNTNYPEIFNITGLVFNTIGAVILIIPNLSIHKDIDDDLIVSNYKDGRYTQRKHIKDRKINMVGLIFILIGFLLQLVSHI